MPRVSAAHLERRRAQILGAALRCFAREGFHRTTMQDVVREAGLSPGALYRYFASKEELIAAIASERHASELAALREAAAGTDALAALRRLATSFLGRLSSPEEQAWRRVTVQVWGEALRSPRVMEVAREGLDEPLRALAALLRRGQHEGRIAADLDPDAAARVGAALFQGLVLQQAWDPGVDVSAYVRTAQALLDAIALPPGRAGSGRRAAPPPRPGPRARARPRR
jgi:AcrR family transcriptional regulator